VQLANSSPSTTVHISDLEKSLLGNDQALLQSHSFGLSLHEEISWFDFASTSSPQTIPFVSDNQLHTLPSFESGVNVDSNHCAFAPAPIVNPLNEFEYLNGVNDTNNANNKMENFNLLNLDGPFTHGPNDPDSIHQQPRSPSHQVGSSMSGSTGSSPHPVSDARVIKRQRNNIAAKKYRQKRIDRITELEEELQKVAREKDELRLELAKKEAEVTTLRSLLERK